MPKYNVQISCFDHIFNVKNIEAINEDEAIAKAVKFVKSKVTSSCVQPVKEKDVFNHIMDVFGWKK